MRHSLSATESCLIFSVTRITTYASVKEIYIFLAASSMLLSRKKPEKLNSSAMIVPLICMKHMSPYIPSVIRIVRPTIIPAAMRRLKMAGLCIRVLSITLMQKHLLQSRNQHIYSNFCAGAISIVSFPLILILFWTQMNRFSISVK